MKPEGWDVPFDDPIPLPGGGTLDTLRAAGQYISALPKRTQDLPQWRRATSDLITAADVDRAWRYFARISVYTAIHGEPKPQPPRLSKSETFRARRRAYKAGKKP